MAERACNTPFLSLPTAFLGRLALARAAEEVGRLRTNTAEGKAP